MKSYTVIYMVLFAIALYFALDGYIGIFAGAVLGYSVGQALDEDKKNGE